MAINFPSSPATNDTFTSPTGLEYIFDGVKWRSFKPSEPVVGTFNANSAISLSAGGTNQNITLTPSGTGVVTTPASVGIGTTTPVSKLSVMESNTDNVTVGIWNSSAYGSGNQLSRIQLGKIESGTYQPMAIIQASPDSNSSSTAGYLTFHTRTGSATSERVRITSAGNVGIGTTTPTQKLSVTVADASQAIQLRGASGMFRIRPYVDATNGVIIDSSNIAESAYLPLTLTGSALRLFGNNGSGIAIDATGNIGMGTTSPLTGTTTFVNAKDPVISNDGGYFGGGLYYDTAWKNSVASQGGWAIRNSSGVLTFYTGAANGAVGSTITASERVRILATGQLLVGGNATALTAIPGSLGNSTIYSRIGMTVVNDTTTLAYFQTYNSNATTDLKTWRHGGQTDGSYVFQIVNDAYSSSTTRLTLTTAGVLSDGKGDVRAAPIQTKSGAYVLVATDAGQTIYISTGGVTINASILSAGDMITIVNNSASNQTITAGASVTFRLAGTATTGNRTLAQYGMATFLCVVGGATPTFHCSGAGLT
jgi:hypothetical protein